MYFARSSLTAVRSTSLNVVNSAAVCWACTNRSAIRLRTMLIGTTSSSGPAVTVGEGAGATAVLGTVGAGTTSGGGTAAAGAGVERADFSTSSLSSRPPGPEAGTLVAERWCSARAQFRGGHHAAADAGAAGTRAWCGRAPREKEPRQPGMRREPKRDAGVRGPFFDVADRLADRHDFSIGLEDLRQDARPRSRHLDGGFVRFWICTRFSSASTRSPSRFSHSLWISTSWIDSPTGRGL